MNHIFITKREIPFEYIIATLQDDTLIRTRPVVGDYDDVEKDESKPLITCWGAERFVVITDLTVEEILELHSRQGNAIGSQLNVFLTHEQTVDDEELKSILIHEAIDMEKAMKILKELVNFNPYKII